MLTPKSSIHTIVTDLDGTLLSADGSISELNRKVLQKAIDSGLLLILATGRRFYSTYKLASYFTGTLPLICNNGQILRMYPTKEKIWQKYLQPDLVLQLIFFGKENINLFILIKISFLSILSASIKLTFLPFVIAIYSALLIKLISNKKNYYFILLIFLIFLFTLILNFPIIGRIPKIIFNLLFIRSDSALDFQDLYYRIFRLGNFIFEIRWVFTH
jgi:hydroxymethylpyrimidine pyrophosphatase-like HAD family hydrolase